MSRIQLRSSLSTDNSTFIQAISALSVSKLSVFPPITPSPDHFANLLEQLYKTSRASGTQMSEDDGSITVETIFAEEAELERNRPHTTSPMEILMLLPQKIFQMVVLYL